MRKYGHRLSHMLPVRQAMVPTRYTIHLISVFKPKSYINREIPSKVLALIRLCDPKEGAPMQPCSACDSWDHEKRSNKNCPQYIPKRQLLTPLARTSVIKCSLDGCCRNNQLKQLMIDSVISCRNTTVVASLLM